MFRKIIFWTFFTMIIIVIFIISIMDSAKLALGLLNRDFEYMVDGSLSSVVIQNERNTDYEFTVSDEQSIADIYYVLASAKEAEEISDLEPDFKFQFIHKNGDIEEFSYVAGIQNSKEQEDGNFYSEDRIYWVPGRLDEFVDRLFNIRKPTKFQDMYYDAILDVLEEYESEFEYSSAYLDIEGDREAARFMMSAHLQEFEEVLAENYENVSIDPEDKEDAEKWIEIKTYGYTSTIYKVIITVHDERKVDETYYVISNYETTTWDTEVYKGTRPDEF